MFFETVSLVDSGCTALAFADHQSVVSKFRLVTKRLARPRSLRLADGAVKSTVTHYFTTRIHIGPHTEIIPIYVSNLGKENPVILGLPWLKRHDPTCLWSDMRIVFNSTYCRHQCLPWDTPVGGQEAPVAQPPPPTPLAPKPLRSCLKLTRSRFKATVEDVPDEEFTTERAHTDGDELLTESHPPPSVHRTAHRPVPVAPRGGARRTARKHTPILKSILKPSPGRPQGSKLNLDDIRNLRGINFIQFCKQKGVFAMRTNLAELRQLVSNAENQTLLGELPTGLVEVPQLREESFRRILIGNYTIEDAERVFDPYFHDFLRMNLNESARDLTLRRKVTQADIDKFMADKTQLTTEDIKKLLPPEFHHHLEHFLPKNAEALPPHRPWDHKIELMPGKEPPHHKNRPFSPEELRCIKKWIDDMLNKGWIRESSSPAAAPLLLAAKPGGGVRICQDYRGLNAVTVKNRYPLPLIRETLDSLCDAKFYTKLDVIAAFNRTRIAQGHEWMTAFITRFGLFETLVTPFGLCNAPATFQNYINHILHDALDTYCTAYLDDVLVYSKTRKEHTTHVDDVIRRLGEAGLQIDIKKSEFYTTKTKYLGLIISTNGLSMDPEKVQAIVDWQDPSSVKELQQFLGFANFYRRFILGYSSIIEPLTRLLKKDTAWSWTSDQHQSFKELKNAFTRAPVLAYFDYSKRTVVETDASNWASGGVLSQYDENGKLRPVAFFSAKHSSAECNYEIYDKELLAIVKALEEWRPELYGTDEPFNVITDHKNLQTFMTTKQLNQRQVRWAEFLSQFNFQIVYRPGSKATLPDALSRIPGSKPADADDERLQYRKRVLLPPDKVDPTILEELLGEARNNGDTDFVTTVTTEPDETALIDLIREGYDKDDTALAMITALLNPDVRRWPKVLRRRLRCDKIECKIVDGLIYFRNRLFVPDYAGLRRTVTHRTHASGPAGHPGRVKTVDLLGRNYWWPGMSRFVADFVAGCELCFRTRTPRSAPPGFLKPLDVPFRAWADISMDHIVDLPPCTRNGKAYRHILVVVDRLTKMRHLIPVTGLETEELVECFLHHVYKLHGAPDSIVSDRGSSFVSAFWQRLSARLKTVLHLSSAFHPQTDGQTEIVNAAVNKYLRAFVAFTQDDWVDWLPLAEFAMNNQISETTGISPFFANYGFNPHMGIEPPRPRPPNLSDHAKKEYLRADAIALRFERILDQLTALTKQSQQRYEDNANARRDEAPTYRPGDLVMVSLENMKTNRPKKKWDDKWDGPFPVLKVYRGAVVVKLPESIKVNNSFHTSKVRLYQAPTISGQDEINAQERRNVTGRVAQRDDEGNIEDKWEFEKILDVHDEDKEESGLTYLVKWKYYNEPTWQPEADLKGCKDILKRFHAANPDKPGPPAWLQSRPRGRPRKTVTVTFNTLR